MRDREGTIPVYRYFPVQRPRRALLAIFAPVNALFSRSKLRDPTRLSASPISWRNYHRQHRGPHGDRASAALKRTVFTACHLRVVQELRGKFLPFRNRGHGRRRDSASTFVPFGTKVPLERGPEAELLFRSARKCYSNRDGRRNFCSHPERVLGIAAAFSAQEIRRAHEAALTRVDVGWLEVDEGCQRLTNRSKERSARPIRSGFDCCPNMPEGV